MNGVMMSQVDTKKNNGKVIVKKCHICGQVSESHKELEKCIKCKKSFLPSNYFHKVHAKNSYEFSKLFSSSEELHEEDLIKGLGVLW